MSKGRLTRQELSWLLTQEAQNAAERLRHGVKGLRTQAAPDAQASPPSETGHVDASLDALDDVMRMLSSLNQQQKNAQNPARRGRIDVAALIVESAPDARVSIEPGSGTEVFGDESELRRMLQVLVSHGSGDGAQVDVRRDGEDVRVAVVLGPDSSPTAETERAWLSRMALRYGGRHELEGGTEIVTLPAEAAGERGEREALRRELDEVRKQGEAYARELAAMFDRGEEVVTISTLPPTPATRAIERLQAVTRTCGAIAAELRAVLAPAIREVGTLRRHEVTDEQLETLRRRFAQTQTILGELAAIGEVDGDDDAEDVDLLDVAKRAAKECAAQADREGVTIDIKASDERRVVRRLGAGVTAIVREVLAHAIAASPRGKVVTVSLHADADAPKRAVRLVVDDEGAALPASSRRAFLTLETHGGAYGRPTALPLFIAAELATCQGASLDLSDAPGGGLRVTVTFANS